MYAHLNLPPGLVKDGTEYQAQNRWRDGGYVRWVQGAATSVGGWRQVAVSAVTGKPRSLLAWKDNLQARWLAIGTHQKLYAYDGGSRSDITPVGLVVGEERGTLGTGYGSCLYQDGVRTYGTGCTLSGIQFDPGYWSLDTWGQDLIAQYNGDGRIFTWTPGGGAATAVTNAPTGNRGAFVTVERHLVALGAGGTARKVQWSHREANTTWTPATTNEAGSYLLETSGVLQRAVPVRGGYLLLTTQDAFLMRYVGPPFVFGFEKVGQDCGLVGQGAVTTNGEVVAWKGRRGFFVYDGQVKKVPCPLEDWLQEDVLTTQQGLIAAGHNHAFNEFWWWYPDSSDQDNDCTRAVLWNYRENWWSRAEFARSAWCDSGVWEYPVAVHPTTGLLLQHEDGWTDASGNPLPSFVTSGPLELGSGDQTLHVRRVMQDFDSTLSGLQVSFLMRDAPNATQRVVGPYSFDTTRGYTDVRASGRQAAVKVENVSATDRWQLGKLRVDLTEGGKR